MLLTEALEAHKEQTNGKLDRYADVLQHEIDHAYDVAQHGQHEHHHHHHSHENHEQDREEEHHHHHHHHHHHDHGENSDMATVVQEACSQEDVKRHACSAARKDLGLNGK